MAIPPAPLAPGVAAPDPQLARRQLLAREPASLQARLGLAEGCLAQGDAFTAAAWLSDACRVAPERPEPATRLGELLLSQRQHAQALRVYQRLYEELGARDRSTLLHYGYCLEQVGELDACIARYREAVTAEPGFFEAHINLAGVLWRVGEFHLALAHAQAAVNLAPDHPYAVRILGTALLQLNRLDEAQAQLRRALTLQPDLALAQVDLAFTLLLAGRLDEGWAWYEKRWNDGRSTRPRFFNPALEWQGPAQPLDGRSVVVYAEQGLGDAIQFLRYLPMLQAQGARVLLAVHPELVPLAAHSFPGVECLTPERGHAAADLHAALLDLPLRFGTTLATIPAQAPYLRVPPERAARWRERLAPWSGRFKVGIAWSGYQRQVNNRNRAIALSEWQEVFGLEDVQCFSLQKSDAGPFTDVQPAEGALLDFTSEWRDAADSAAMIDGLDLVVTVDTAIAHLAGALARPTWVLLPPNPDFRWLLERDDSPWYPTARLFRRDAMEPRSAQMARVLAALRERVARHVRGAA
jgi:Flp pilus assembly protein TadD